MRVTFGDCVFDRGRRELTRHGASVHTGQKLLGLLELLIDSAPRAVTKKEIHRALWPDTFVSDATLTSLVTALRQAVGDAARAPRLVRTIHGYGYAFVGTVSCDGSSIAHSPDQSRAFRIILGDREIALPAGVHVLGRSADCAVFVDDTGVSRHHARITVGADRATLDDLGSKNGTILDGHRIEGTAVLADGSLIVLGATALKFRIFDAASSTETVSRHTEN